MTTRHAVVWLDHNEAHIFHLTPESYAGEVIRSPHAHSKLHRKAGPKASSGHANEDPHYYHDVAMLLAGTEEILVVGPANAKDAFVRHLENHHHDLKSRIVAVETLDHPTDKQIVAHARAYFKREGTL
ncbi:translational machinery protein [Polyangium fumosum]|uniref:Translational machinery protein n=1 Tax=Polyangium fumosum TaxID=889272 RepID=A0A4U1JFS2_9BACT|nr:translational machinery protein [Polyangium fumosum]TKD09947.1 translational machinery protein [Polyangium fumosum]